MNPIWLIAIIGGVLYLVKQEEESPDGEPPKGETKEFSESLTKLGDPKKIIELPQEEVTRLRRELRQALARKKNSTKDSTTS